MTVIRTQSRNVNGQLTKVIVQINDAQAKRVFIKFADKDAKERAGKVLLAAKAEAPVKTGKLRSSIQIQQSRDLAGRFGAGYDVSANVNYSVFVHEGTRPHKITGNPLLGFYWAKVNRFVVLPSVNHPGTKPNKFLVRALRRAR